MEHGCDWGEILSLRVVVFLCASILSRSLSPSGLVNLSSLCLGLVNSSGLIDVYRDHLLGSLIGIKEAFN